MLPKGPFMSRLIYPGYRLRALAAAIVLAACASTVLPVPSRAQKSWSIDPDTGLVCVSSDCTYVRAPRNNNCICKKVWPNNDRRSGAVRLDCVQKSKGRWIACEQ